MWSNNPRDLSLKEKISTKIGLKMIKCFLVKTIVTISDAKVG
jgi:hypothetical protein